ncbi:hypothetical protein ACTJIJ_09440 [Niabella sp. 22666]|uniref:hypothetical protein n=1 Tax=Niabella sp. 22666 TaxID=3453954 RepID=UPI003F837CE9
MKSILLIAAIAALFSCYSLKKGKLKSYEGSLDGYKVYKVDSINAYYLIYAIKDGSRYKIVSKKNHNNCKEKIEINKVYLFDLQPTLENRKIAGDTLLSQNTLLVNCFSYDDTTQICFEDNMLRELYNAKNVKGICFIKK